MNAAEQILHPAFPFKLLYLSPSLFSLTPLHPHILRDSHFALVPSIK